MKQGYIKFITSILILQILLAPLSIVRLDTAAAYAANIQPTTTIQNIYIEDLITEILKPILESNLAPLSTTEINNLRNRLRQTTIWRAYVAIIVHNDRSTMFNPPALEIRHTIVHSEAPITIPEAWFTRPVTAFAQLPNTRQVANHIYSLDARQSHSRFINATTPVNAPTIGGPVSSVQYFYVELERPSEPEPDYGQPEVQNIGEIHIDYFIENMLEPLVEPFDSNSLLVNIDYDLLIERVRQNPYITQYRTWHTQLEGFPIGSVHHYRHVFKSNPAFTPVYENALAPRLPFSGPFSIPNSTGRAVADIRGESIHSPVMGLPPGFRPYWFLPNIEWWINAVPSVEIGNVTGRNNHGGMMVIAPLTTNNIILWGMVTHVRQFKIVFDEEPEPEPEPTDPEPEPPPYVDYYAPVITIYIEDFIENVLLPLNYRFPAPHGPLDFAPIRRHIEEGFRKVEIYVTSFTGDSLIMGDIHQELFYFSHYTTSPDIIWTVPQNLRNRSTNAVSQGAPLGGYRRLFIYATEEMLYRLWTHPEFTLVDSYSPFGLLGTGWYFFGRITNVYRYYIVLGELDPDPDPDPDDECPVQGGCCQCPYPPTVNIFEEHFHEHHSHYTIIENHYHEHIENHFHEYIENHFHEYHTHYNITEEHFHEHFITEYHTHEHITNYITERHTHEHITNYITNVYEIHFHPDAEGNWPPLPPDWPGGGMDTEMLELILRAIRDFHQDTVSGMEEQTEIIVVAIEDQTEEITGSIEHFLETFLYTFDTLIYFFEYWFEGFGVLLFLLFTLANIAFVIWIVVMIWKGIYFHVIQAWL